MILSRTPIRISLMGGSTDIPNFYRQYGARSSALLSTNISLSISQGDEIPKLQSTPQTTVKRFLTFAAGAIRGKILGAGGGGYFLF